MQQNPTPSEILRRRAEIHRARGEHLDAEILLGRRERQDRAESSGDEEDDTDPRLRYIIDMDLPTRIMGPLERRGVYLVGDLCGYSEERLLLFREFGDRSIKVIKDALASIGLSLRESLPGDVVPPLPEKVACEEPPRTRKDLIDDHQRSKIFELMAAGFSQREIAKEVRIARWTVWKQFRALRETIRGMLSDGATEEETRHKVGALRWNAWQRVKTQSESRRIALASDSQPRNFRG